MKRRTTSKTRMRAEPRRGVIVERAPEKEKRNRDVKRNHLKA
jgi:hypothetical protein